MAAKIDDTPPPLANFSVAYRRCEALTRSHYENFPVARLIPRALRPHVSAIYAFARTADDMADEGWDDEGGVAPEAEQRVAALDAFEDDLMRAAAGQSVRPEYAWIFIPLAHTLRCHALPVQLFRDLLSAFRQDCTKRRYADFAEVLDYCRRSANPVGRIVLLLHGHDDESLFDQSDAICTALQLANFWQDIGADWKKDRRSYIPLADWEQFGLDEVLFDSGRDTPAVRDCMRFQVQRTWRLFDRGRALPSHLPFPLSWEIRLTWLGGTTILRKIHRLDYATLGTRPVIHRWDKARLLMRSVLPLCRTVTPD